MPETRMLCELIMLIADSRFREILTMFAANMPPRDDLDL